MKPELVKYRLERAEETLLDAELLLSKNRLIASVNRLYYSMFYAISAILEVNDFSSSKHSGVRSLFNQHFVKTGIISMEAGSQYNILYNERHKGDYSDFVEFERTQVSEYYDNCRKHIDEIRHKILETMGPDF